MIVSYATCLRTVSLTRLAARTVARCLRRPLQQWKKSISVVPSFVPPKHRLVVLQVMVTYNPGRRARAPPAVEKGFGQVTQNDLRHMVFKGDPLAARVTEEIAAAAPTSVSAPDRTDRSSCTHFRIAAAAPTSVRVATQNRSTQYKKRYKIMRSAYALPNSRTRRCV